MNIAAVVRQFESAIKLKVNLLTGTAGASPAELALHALIFSILIQLSHVCSRYALAAGETPAVPVKKMLAI